jgi:hypothetical protein
VVPIGVQRHGHGIHADKFMTPKQFVLPSLSSTVAVDLEQQQAEEKSFEGENKKPAPPSFMPPQELMMEPELELDDDEDDQVVELNDYITNEKKDLIATPSTKALSSPTSTAKLVACGVTGFVLASTFGVSAVLALEAGLALSAYAAFSADKAAGNEQQTTMMMMTDHHIDDDIVKIETVTASPARPGLLDSSLSSFQENVAALLSPLDDSALEASSTDPYSNNNNNNVPYFFMGPDAESSTFIPTSSYFDDDNTKEVAQHPAAILKQKQDVESKQRALVSAHLTRDTVARADDARLAEEAHLAEESYLAEEVRIAEQCGLAEEEEACLAEAALLVEEAHLARILKWKQEVEIVQRTLLSARLTLEATARAGEEVVRLAAILKQKQEVESEQRALLSPRLTREAAAMAGMGVARLAEESRLVEETRLAAILKPKQDVENKQRALVEEAPLAEDWRKKKHLVYRRPQ